VVRCACCVHAQGLSLADAENSRNSERLVYALSGKDTDLGQEITGV